MLHCGSALGSCESIWIIILVMWTIRTAFWQWPCLLVGLSWQDTTVCMCTSDNIVITAGFELSSYNCLPLEWQKGLRLCHQFEQVLRHRESLQLSQEVWLCNIALVLWVQIPPCVVPGGLFGYSITHEYIHTQFQYEGQQYVGLGELHKSSVEKKQNRMYAGKMKSC